MFLPNFSLFNHVLFRLILTYDFLNYIEIMNWVFEIKVSIFGCKNIWSGWGSNLEDCSTYVILRYKVFYTLNSDL